MATWREQQAQGTRRQIVQAARECFAAQGYAGTTIEAIAAQAGVAVPTVYKAFGNKRSITLQLNELIDEQGGVLEIVAQLRTTEDPAEMLRLAIRIGRQLYERCGDIIALVRSAAASEPELATVYAEGRRRHVGGVSSVVERIAAAGALQVDVDYAVGLLGHLTSAETFAELGATYGWSAEITEQRLANSLAVLLLADPR